MAEKLNRNRIENLKTLLVRERNRALARVREYRRDQAEDATAPPMDELDSARTLAEVETHASLIEQVENRIKQIDTRFFPPEQGGYGVCEECASEIPLARLEGASRGRWRRAGDEGAGDECLDEKLTVRH